MLPTTLTDVVQKHAARVGVPQGSQSYSLWVGGDEFFERTAGIHIAFAGNPNSQAVYSYGGNFIADE